MSDSDDKFLLHLPAFGFDLDRKFLPRENATTFPTISNSINTSIIPITNTSTPLEIPMAPPSGIVLALRGAVVYACLIEVNDNSSDEDSLFSIEVDGGNGDNDLSCPINMDGDSSDEDSVDQQTVYDYFIKLAGVQHTDSIIHKGLPVLVCVWTSALGMTHVGGLLMVWEKG